MKMKEADKDENERHHRWPDLLTLNDRSRGKDGDQRHE